MPVFSKLMGNYPLNLIRGLGSNVRVGAGVGAGLGAGYGAMTGRGGPGRTAGYAVAGAAIGGAGVAGYSAMGGMTGLRTFGRNMMRPGAAGAFGRMAYNSAANAAVASPMGRKALVGASGMMGRMGGFLKGLAGRL